MKVTFYATPFWRGARGAGSRDFVSITRVISKRAAKHDKAAIKAQKHDGIKPKLAPERAFAAAGLRNHAALA